MRKNDNHAPDAFTAGELREIIDSLWVNSQGRYEAYGYISSRGLWADFLSWRVEHLGQDHYATIKRFLNDI